MINKSISRRVNTVATRPPSSPSATPVTSSKACRVTKTSTEIVASIVQRRPSTFLGSHLRQGLDRGLILNSLDSGPSQLSWNALGSDECGAQAEAIRSTAKRASVKDLSVLIWLDDSQAKRLQACGKPVSQQRLHGHRLRCSQIDGLRPEKWESVAPWPSAQ